MFGTALADHDLRRWSERLAGSRDIDSTVCVNALRQGDRLIAVGSDDRHFKATAGERFPFASPDLSMSFVRLALATSEKLPPPHAAVSPAVRGGSVCLVDLLRFTDPRPVIVLIPWRDSPLYLSSRRRCAHEFLPEYPQGGEQIGGEGFSPVMKRHHGLVQRWTAAWRCALPSRPGLSGCLLNSILWARDPPDGKVGWGCGYSAVGLLCSPRVPRWALALVGAEEEVACRWRYSVGRRL